MSTFGVLIFRQFAVVIQGEAFEVGNGIVANDSGMTFVGTLAMDDFNTFKMIGEGVIDGEVNFVFGNLPRFAIMGDICNMEFVDDF